jgi:hypothetical protein
LRYFLDSHVKEDPRLLDVYVEAKRYYAEMDLCQHNFHHVIRDLYRGLMIAASEEPVKYTVLIPSILLHDIGFSDPAFRTEGHDVVGARIASTILRSFGFDEPTCHAVCHCVRSHKGKAELPETIEAKILYDADVLEKAGAVALIQGGKIICVWQTSMNTAERDRGSQREIARGFYTAKARKLTMAVRKS